jgi:hypothetical protein
MVTHLAHNVSVATAPTEQAESQEMLLQLMDPANRADPYGLYAQFREQGALQLAEAKAGIALSAITARFPDARLDSEPHYKANVTLRGLSELTVAV